MQIGWTVGAGESADWQEQGCADCRWEGRTARLLQGGRRRRGSGSAWVVLLRDVWIEWRKFVRESKSDWRRGLLSTWGPVFSSAVIEITDQYGGTSGRFGVADMIARVFPAHRAFVDAVTDEEVREGIHPPSSFPSGPYPKDKLTYRSKDLVEYETSAETEGLGTQSRLLKNGDPICGVAMLVGQTPDLVHLSVRLPLDVTDLAPLIIQQVERDAANSRGN
jgi:hypothetical protein